MNFATRQASTLRTRPRRNACGRGLPAATSCLSNSNSNSNNTFIALNLCQKTDSKAHHTKTLFNIQKPET